MHRSDSQRVGQWVETVLRCAAATAPAAQGPVYVAARRGGIKVWEAWHDNGPWEAALQAIFGDRLSRETGDDKPDAFEVSLTDFPRSVDPRRQQAALSNAHRGVRGLQVAHNGDVVRFAPTDMIARNLSFRRGLELAADLLAECRNSVGGGELPAGATVSLFDSVQVLLRPGPPPRAVRMVRGKVPVAPADVSRQSVTLAATRMAEWLTANLSPDGRMVYKYFPSRGAEAGTNNALRQWMATLCMLKWARRQGGGPHLEAALSNLHYNLNTSYRREGALGIIDDGGKVKLGGVALAALAVAESPRREELADVERSLAATIDHLWRDDGSFRTFLRPAERNDCQNFYPGEALLYWSHCLTSTHDAGREAIVSRFMKTAANYQAWHRVRPNPAFVPWHTQACVSVWQQTRDQRLREWVFAMNDWLLGMQQWETAPYEDMRGRFYDPLHPDYGPPHASSDGVYLEGLAEAFALARHVGDAVRLEDYRVAIARGLRHALQLQFEDETDLYYVSKRSRVHGALRTTVYDNTIRVDNVQHNLMAAMRVLDLFSPGDYVVPA